MICVFVVMKSVLFTFVLFTDTVGANKAFSFFPVVYITAL